MATTHIINVTVPDGDGDPTELVKESLQRTVGRVIPVWEAPLDDDPVFQNAEERAIIVERVVW